MPKREIEFRVWQEKIPPKRKGRMIYFDLDEYGRDQDSECGQGDIDIDSNPLMQFTGLKDKNGKDIYEGDIVDFFKEIGAEKGEEKEARGEVQFDYGEFYIDGYRLFRDLKGYIIFYKGPEWGEVKVIGNIYENKDLLTD